MAFLFGVKREDLRDLAVRLGENPVSLRILELKKIILNSSEFEEEKVRNFLKLIIEERIERENEKERLFELEKIETERQFQLKKLEIRRKTYSQVEVAVVKSHFEDEEPKEKDILILEGRTPKKIEDPVQVVEEDDILGVEFIRWENEDDVEKKMENGVYEDEDMLGIKFIQWTDEVEEKEDKGVAAKNEDYDDTSDEDILGVEFILWERMGDEIKEKRSRVTKGRKPCVEEAEKDGNSEDEEDDIIGVEGRFIQWNNVEADEENKVADAKMADVEDELIELKEDDDFREMDAKEEVDLNRGLEDDSDDLDFDDKEDDEKNDDEEEEALVKGSEKNNAVKKQDTDEIAKQTTPVKNGKKKTAQSPKVKNDVSNKGLLIRETDRDENDSEEKMKMGEKEDGGSADEKDTEEEIKKNLETNDDVSFEAQTSQEDDYEPQGTANQNASLDDATNELWCFKGGTLLFLTFFHVMIDKFGIDLRT